MNQDFFLYLVAGAFVIWFSRKAFIRLRLSAAKHPSLRGHAKMSRRFAKLVPYFSYNKRAFFATDNAPQHVVNHRADGLFDLTSRIENENANSIDFTHRINECISDVKFTNNYRVPFPYREQLPLALKATPIADESSGPQIKSVDGHWRYDLFASYGVNVFGYDFYKTCMSEGSKLVEKLGPVLGPYHPLIQENVEKLKAISGLDEVSFHMSGTEAVMQAVRLARYHTRKTHLVRFCGAYHGWWDGVQPGVGNQRKTNDVYTLADLSENTIKVLSTRNDIACVLINPMQAFHPNSDSPSDATLIASDRQMNFNKQAYTTWLKRIRKVCSERGIVLIFDEVFTGFRLAYRGAQEYFGIQADLVTYGKTLGGGYPVGAVCGLHYLMKRYRDDAPADLSFARGTFNSHPAVIGAMNVFLKRIAQDDIQSIYRHAESTWDQRVEKLNAQLAEQNLPIVIRNMHSIISVVYTVPSRYNWMLQFYMRAEGLEPGWIGTGRFIMSLDYSDDDFTEVSKKFITAANKMKTDLWWWHDGQTTNKQLKRMFLRDMLSARFPKFAGLVGNKKNRNNDLTDQPVSL